MKILLTLLIIFLIFPMLGLSHGDSEKEAADVPNIIIITMLGVRNIDSIKDFTHQYIPNLWGKIFKEGVLYTNLINTNFEFHMPTLRAINTGIDYPDWHDAAAPSIFQYVRKKYNLPSTKLWVIGSLAGEKDFFLKTDEYSETSPENFSFTFVMYFSPQLKKILTDQELTSLTAYENILKQGFFRWSRWNVVDRAQFSFFKKIMQEFKPKLVHYAAHGIECGHCDTYSQSLLALKQTDKDISEIWEFINNDKFYKNNTYLIICVDHERNEYYMEHSDNPPDNPSRVWMYIYGPGVRKGGIINRPVYHRDIFVTVAYLMNVTTHETKGRILKDCFLGR
jgi:hypothetical protein